MRPKLWVLSTYPSNDASQRLRIDPLIAAFTEQSAASLSHHTILPPWAFRRRNASRVWRTLVGVRLLVGCCIRLLLILRVRPSDVVLAHREAFPFFTPIVELFLVRRSRAFIVDVDDAIHVSPTHVPNWRDTFRVSSNSLKYFEAADLVLCGSPVMRHLVKELGGQSVLVPTCPPVELFSLPLGSREPVIAWIGSQSTLGSLQMVLDSLLQFAEEQGYRLNVLGSDNVKSLRKHPLLTSELWSPEKELALLRIARYGLMPLPDTEWENGKSSYKALQYMAAGVYPVVSDLGMNVWLKEHCEMVSIQPDQTDWKPPLVSLVNRHRFGEEFDTATSENREFMRRFAHSSTVAATVAAIIESRLDRASAFDVEHTPMGLDELF